MSEQSDCSVDLKLCHSDVHAEKLPPCRAAENDDQHAGHWLDDLHGVTVGFAVVADVDATAIVGLDAAVVRMGEVKLQGLEVRLRLVFHDDRAGRLLA